MRKIYSLANKISRAEAGKTVKMFMVFNVIAWSLIATILAFVLDFSGLFQGFGFARMIFVCVGYAVFFPGIIGGSIYLMRK